MLVSKTLKLCYLTLLSAFLSFITSCSVFNIENNIEETTYFPTEDERSKMAVNLQLVLPANIHPYHLKQLDGIYKANDLLPIWYDSNIRNELEMQLAEVALAGIQPEFSIWIKWLADPELKGISRDIVLSDALLGYLHFIQEARKIGNKGLYGGNAKALVKPSIKLVNEFQTTITNNTLKHWLNGLAPQHSVYKPMRDVLHRVLKDQNTWPALNISNTLRPGEKLSLEDYTALHIILKRQFAWSGETIEFSSSSTEHPYYNKELVEQIKHFQLRHGLNANGIIDQQTKKLLINSPVGIANKLALNIQRLRSLPAQIDTVILVNIPDYGLHYYINGNEVLYSRTIVGRVARKTPIMLNELSNVVLNPPWNVPPTLLREDVIPKIKRDPSYLKRNGFTMYNSWSKDAETINPEDIDWSLISNKDPQLRIQQSPGRGNSLGRFKFNMPNAEAIYLHDTPNHNIFSKDIRALSSGCVRVDKAADLAEIILTQVGWNKSRINNILSEGKTTYININNKIPVYLYYMTMWVTNDGVLQIRNDIYDYDKGSSAGQSNLPLVKTLLHF